MSKLIKEKIRTVPHWPIVGVMFRDITTLIEDPEGFRHTCDLFHERYRDMDIDKIVGIDARGFIFGGVLAYQLGVGFTPVRKKGKLPYSTIEESYELEYGEATVEIHDDSIKKGERVVIIDDLIATGGTMVASANLVERLGGEIVELSFVIELIDLGGRDKLKKYDMFSLTKYKGE